MQSQWATCLLGAMAAVTLVSCKTVPNNKSDLQSVRMTTTSGDIVDVFSVGSNMVIRDCAAATPLPSDGPCTIKPGTHDDTLPLEMFRENLINNYMTVLVSDDSGTAKFISDMRNGDKKLTRAQFEKQERIQLAEAGGLKSLIDAMSAVAGGVDVSRYQLRLREIQKDYEIFEKHAQAVLAFYDLVTNLVDNLIQNIQVTTLSPDDPQTAFAYHLLRGYLTSVAVPSLEFVAFPETTLILADGSPLVVPAFEISKTEVTQLQYYKANGKKPSGFINVEDCPDSHMIIKKSYRDEPVQEIKICPKLPATNLTAIEAADYANSRYYFDHREDLPQPAAYWQYHLTSELQMDVVLSKWRELFRTSTPAQWQQLLARHAWLSDSGIKLHNVASKEPDSDGMFDLLGNATETVVKRYVSYTRQPLPAGSSDLGSAYRLLTPVPLRTIVETDYGCSVKDAGSDRECFLPPVGTYTNYSTPFKGFRVVRTKIVP